GESREDALEHDVARHLDHAQSEAGEHDHVEHYVGEEAEERVPVSRHPPADRMLGARHARHVSSCSALAGAIHLDTERETAGSCRRGAGCAHAASTRTLTPALSLSEGEGALEPLA